MVLSGLSFQRAFLSVALTILLSASAGLRAAEPDDVAGTMPEDYLPGLKPILAQAMRRSPEMIAREFDRMAQEARLTLARSSRLPQFGGNFNYGITETATASQSSTKERNDGFFYNFGLSQALFHWGALKNQTESARLNLLASDKATARLYREISVALRKTYLALIVEKARLQQARESLRIVSADVEVARTKKKDGSISGAALAGEELRLREATVALERVEADFAANRRRFARLAGLAELPEDSIPTEIPAPVYREPLAAAMTATLLRENAKSTLEYEIYDLRVREAVLRQKIENTRLLPKLGLSANYSLENTTNVNNNLAEQRAVTRQTIGVGGSWNIFDGFATRGAKREALAARRSVEQQRDAELDQLLQTAQILHRSLGVDAEQANLADIRYGTAVEGRRLVSEGVQRGTVPKAELARAQVNILQMHAANMEARALFLGRWCDFVAIAGDDPVLNNISDRDVRKKN